MATGLKKVSFHSKVSFHFITKKGNVKECSNYHTVEHISHASKVMLKILQARLQQYVNWELPDVQAGFRKAEESDQIANIHWIIEKAREFQKKLSTSTSLTMLKPLTVWLTTNWKILKETGTPNHITCLQRNLYEGQDVTETVDWFKVKVKSFSHVWLFVTRGL